MDDLVIDDIALGGGGDWALVTDGVMGGLSGGRLERRDVAGRSALRLSGAVSLANNGGFIQTAVPFARRGYAVNGLDLNPNAVDFCNARFARHGLPQSVFVADMSDFKLKRPFDIAFNTINSFRHVASEAAARDHLRCMADASPSGAIYLLGIHLTPTSVPPSETESWSARRGHLAINTHMWFKSRDTRKRVERFGIRFDVHTPSRQFRINDELVLRSYTAPQMNRLLASVPDWEVVGTYDFGYDMDGPIEVDSSTEDVVYVLRRR